MIEQLTVLEEKLGVKFKDIKLLEYALTHRSTRGDIHYERFEFLGDAVVDLAVAHLLFEAHPELQEGDLSKMRAALVSTSGLAEVGKEIGLGEYIRLSKQEIQSGGSERPSILADVVEAIFGALYTDSGFDVALQMARRIFSERAIKVTPLDPKTELQELLHTKGFEPPVYRLEFTEGPEHSPEFISVVEINGEVKGRGKGQTKKASQQSAALEALTLLREPNIEENKETV